MKCLFLRIVLRRGVGSFVLLHSNRGVTAIRIPSRGEAAIREDVADIDADAREPYAVELYRRGKLSHHHLATVLKLDRFETEGVLKRHPVIEDLPGDEELDRQATELKALRREKNGCWSFATLRL